MLLVVAVPRCPLCLAAATTGPQLPAQGIRRAELQPLRKASMLLAIAGTSLIRRRRCKRLVALQGSYDIRTEMNPMYADDIDDDIDWQVPTTEDLEKWDEDGEKWILSREGPRQVWRKEIDHGTYRFTRRGYESKDPDGVWVSSAQMPEDVSHLTEAQRERLIEELKGNIKVSLADGSDDETFVPMAKLPPLEKWPFWQVDVSDDLKPTPELLEDYKILEMTEDIGRAFFLSARWKQSNEARRHLGYNVNDRIEDIANLNATVIAFRSMVEQLKRLSRFRKATDEDEKPSDAARLRDMQCTGILGTTRGSAAALWLHYPEKKRLAIDLCLGDDCMDQGPYAEEVLLRILISKGMELGCEKVWCRTRRTESGKVQVCEPLKHLGFTAVPLDEQEEEEWEKFKAFEEELQGNEAVPGLYLWMTTRDLGKFVDLANQWCSEMGAADIHEVVENKQELADFLDEHGLTEEERERVLRY
eukprot:TRINITY_DN22402_c0_g1_i1.p1 TRINITY_DN22402_c0_g1~~TRINITY_DN22402_c0_g1_i1.p1  ORF type:complete len:474 (-),score=97.52 TRINITY_DN22402_c0_g1_i1:82-1503(-)